MTKAPAVASDLPGSGRPAPPEEPRADPDRAQRLPGEAARAPLDELLVRQVADALVYADRSGTIRRWNHAAAALFGFQADETLGRNLDLIIPERLREAHWRGWDAAFANRSTRTKGRPTLTRAVHKDGRKLYVEMSFALVLGDDGAPLGAVAMARDATERMARERAAGATR